MQKESSHFFYGWLVLFAAFALLFLVHGSRAIFGVTFKPIVDEFAWGRASVSLAVMLNMIVFALMLPVVGKCFDRYGARRVIFFSCAFIAIGFIGLTQSQSFSGFLFFYGIITAIGFGGTSVPLVAALISHWFDTYRGFAISMALAGGCLGHFFVVHITTWSVRDYDWRMAYLICGVLTFLVGAAMVGFIIRNRPSEIGLTPYHRSRSEIEKTAKLSVLAHQSIPDLSLPEAVHTRSFWFYTFIMFVCGGGDYLVLTHLVPMVTDFGISQTVAGNMLAWFGILSFAGVLAAGWAVDRIGHKPPVVITFFLRFLLFALVLKYQNTLSFYVFALGFGFTHFITAPITTTLLIKLYGFSHVGVISGLVTTVHHIGGGVWAWWAGFVFDTTGSYNTVLAAYAIACLFASLCGLLIQERRHEPRKGSLRN
jgi:MFS family permease